MSYFDKFMKDLEKKTQKREEKKKELSRDNSNHHVRQRVRLYAEKWQNSIRYGWRKPNNE